MAGRPRRSCDSCNAQKLRCGGEKPSCARCTRLSRPCVYKPVAAALQARRRASSHASAHKPVPASEYTGSPLRLNPPEKRYFGVPSALLPTLVDLYFTYIYNARLLFHRPSLEAALEAQSVRSDIVLCFCALAAKFFRDPKGSAVLVENGFCREWAEEAGRVALQEVESPCSENIVVFLNLSLFWYSMDDYRRAAVQSGIASSTAWTIGLPFARQEVAEPLQAEIRRRRFWACYLLNAFLQDSLFPKVPTEAMLRASLPCRQEDFDRGRPQGGVTLKSGESSQSIYAELIRAMAVWSAVVALTRQPESNLATRLSDIQALDGRIHDTYSRLASCFHLDPANISLVPPDDLANLLLLHIIYHQCWCSLHSSIVPLFSWSAFDDSCAYAQQLSGQTALEHANAVSFLLEATLASDWDAARLPSFIGYAAYAACAIQTPFLWCSKPDVKQRAVRSILANLQTMQVMGRQWRFTKILGRFACGLYKLHASRVVPLTDEPKNMSPAALRGFKMANPRARLSILTHNTIIVSEEGCFARGAEDIGDLGLDDPGTRESNLEEDSIAAFITQISRECREMNGQLPVMLDPFLPSENLDYYDFGGGFDVANEVTNVNSMGHIEDWISELLQQEG
ncbi:hypothetical protein PV08_10192 [Exophiala spinifera]|uniref:Zn(2)-C6 fungal-type domain-containing protein n=1 Tax=Exophiala spinifera TaxID=91928 RepID=A0A0D2AVY6_9EURO|nr:uncharacterized protein PV08_10192 [Exophiala spinifera]KIW10893.1 hypothetical protein PV08_10192 [Exophiala spinifera]